MAPRRSLLLPTLLAAAAVGSLTLTGCGSRTGEPATTTPAPPAQQVVAGSRITAGPGVGLGDPAAPGDPVRVRLDADLPTGATPRLAYAVGGSLVRPDGPTTSLPHEDYSSLAVIGDTVLAVRDAADGLARLDLLGPDGERSTQTARGPVVSSSDATVAAWATPEGQPVTFGTQQDGPVTLRASVSPVVVRAVSGSGTCYEQPPTYGCAVAMEPLEAGPAQMTSSHGISDQVGPHVVGVSDLGPRGRYAASSDTGCVGVAEWDWRWHDCRSGHALGRFSADGRLLVGLSLAADGDGYAAVSVLDATTGEPLLRATAGDGRVTQVRWEGSDLLLVARDDTHGTRVLRLAPDGHLEVALDGALPADLLLSGNS